MPMGTRNSPRRKWESYSGGLENLIHPLPTWRGVDRTNRRIDTLGGSRWKEKEKNSFASKEEEEEDALSHERMEFPGS